MFYVDSHIHLQDYKTKDVKSIVKNAQNFNVRFFVNPSAHPQDWSAVDALATQYSSVIPAYGVHPWHTQAVLPDWIAALENRLQHNKSAWVGECGIDRLKNPNIESQTAILMPQIALAKQYARPLIIHAVKADEIMGKLFHQLPPQTVFHSFTGSAEWGKKIQQKGFFIGLNFSILRKKNAAQIVQSLDFSQVLLETDGPYQSPEKNTETMPQDLPLLADKIAQMRCIPLAELEQILYQNWLKFKGEK